MKSSSYHESVMVQEAVGELHVKKTRKYIDATLGTGGHAIEIAGLGGEVLGIEMDPKMLTLAKERLEKAYPAPKLVQGNFTEIDEIAEECGFGKVSGILFDLGVSNLHLTHDPRGFSFSDPSSPLDMRLDPETQGVSARDLINALRQDQLADLFGSVMEKGPSRWLAGNIVEKRLIRPFSTVGDFLEAVRGLRAKPGLNPATLPFLALRIAVNSELDNLVKALPKAFDLLEKGGRMIVISFHSGEDMIVKKFLGKSKLIFPTHEEVEKNPRARSAKMRVLIKE